MVALGHYTGPLLLCRAERWNNLYPSHNTAVDGVHSTVTSIAVAVGWTFNDAVDCVVDWLFLSLYRCTPIVTLVASWDVVSSWDVLPSQTLSRPVPVVVSLHHHILSLNCHVLCHCDLWCPGRGCCLMPYNALFKRCPPQYLSFTNKMHRPHKSVAVDC